MSMPEQAILMLADGTVFEGISVGAPGISCGEVIFNTAQTGYQEILTDPSYAEQIIIFTQPHIGNVGVNTLDMESTRMWAAGAIMRSFCETPSNWRAERSLREFFQAENKMAISGIDTRALTLHLRETGCQNACIMTGASIDRHKALKLAQTWGGIDGRDLAIDVTTSKTYTWTEGSTKPRYKVVVVDYGVKRSILRELIKVDCEVIVVPAQSTAKEILAHKPDGVVLSNGPGDPAACDYAIATIRDLLAAKIPLFGICLGHQLLALACDAETEKMRFGHHGGNHPILDVATQKVFISSQNHCYTVAEDSLPAHLQVTHRSLFDNSIGGIARLDVPAFGFQGHPEAGPGPTELTALFKQFTALLG